MNLRSPRATAGFRFATAVGLLAIVTFYVSIILGEIPAHAPFGAKVFVLSIACSALAFAFVVCLVHLRESFLQRTLFLAVLIAVASTWLQDATIQTALAWGIVVGLLVTYRRFVGKMFLYVLSHPSQAIVVVVYFCLLYGFIGGSYGVPSLFWHESFFARLLSAIGSVLLLATLGTSAFFLDDNYLENQRAFRQFQKEWHVDYGLNSKRLLRSRKRAERRGATPLEYGLDTNRWLRRFERMLDWLEPEPRFGPGWPGSNAVRVSRFLRVVRLPFLTLVALPALLPLAFPGVPRLAPVGRLPWPAETHLDVGRDPVAWLIGVFCWGLGILIGVFVVKGLVQLSVWTELRLVGLGKKLQNVFNKLKSLPKWFWNPVLSWISTATVILAVVLTMMLNARYAMNLPDGTWFQWLNYAAVAAALLMGIVWSGYRAYELRPNRWPPFARYLSVSVATYVLLAAYDTLLRWLYPTWFFLVSPGLAICAFLIMLSLFGAWLRQLRPKREQSDCYRSDLIALALVAVWIGVMNGDDYKMRFRSLRSSYDKDSRGDWSAAVKELGEWGARDFTPPDPDHIAPEKGLRRSEGLKNDEDVLKNWRRYVWWRKQGHGPLDQQGAPPANFKPKLAVVCATGGASRAAYWTARVLDRLGRPEMLPGFHDGVRLITGASGGMIGAAYYLRWRQEFLRDNPEMPVASLPQKPTDWVEEMPTDALSAVASHIGLVSVAQALVPRLPEPLDLDRGQVLEMQWPQLQHPFLDYRRDEGLGAIPSVVFSPVTVDDGRRLIISNLGLERLAINWGEELDAVKSGPSVYSIAAPEFYRVFGAAGKDLNLATAARMSATFPIVSPAVNLPTDPPIRVVDAGYYDNYGVNLAVAWIFKNRNWLERNTSGVALVQIRAFRGRKERLGPAAGGGDALANGIQFFSTPLEAFAGARDSTPMFRNDEEVAALAEVLTRDCRQNNLPHFSFATVIFELTSQVRLDTSTDEWPFHQVDDKARNAPPVTDVAMTWYLSRPEKRSMDRAIPEFNAADKWELKGQEPAKIKSVDHRGSFENKPADRLRLIDIIRKRLREVPDEPENQARRSYYIKELERALNYERLRALKSWWEKG
jgi:hypothetical protein